MALLQRTRKVPPPPSQPVADRAPDALAAGVGQPLRGELEELLGADRVLHRVRDLVAYASDASPYRLFPRAVVMAHDADDVAKVLAFGRERGVPVTFRAGGTSLNGQGQSDGILVDVRRHFGGVAGEDDGARARVKPGTILGHANRVLAPHGRKLGPDPASTDVGTVGGVVANNSGGMRCGVTKDSYSTVRELTFVLPSGTVIDTGAPTRRNASPPPSRSWSPASRRSATRSAPTPSSPSGSAASSRSRTRPATGSAPSSTPTSRWRSSAASSSARRAPSPSSPRSSSRRCRCRR